MLQDYKKVADKCLLGLSCCVVASDLSGILDEMLIYEEDSFPDRDDNNAFLSTTWTVTSRIKYSTTHWCVIHCEGVKLLTLWAWIRHRSVVKHGISYRHHCACSTKERISKKSKVFPFDKRLFFMK